MTLAAPMTLPPELTNLPHWIVWRLEERLDEKTGEMKPVKIPYNAKTAAKASTTDAKTWATYERAQRAFDRGDYTGLGFVFSKNDNLVGIDIDHCIDLETNTTEARAWSIVQQLDSYAERSPSGTGIHVFVKGDLPPGGRRRGNVEMYSEGRFFTITGRHVDGAPLTVNERTAQLAELHRDVFGATTNGHANNGPRALSIVQPLNLSDTELLTRAQQAKNGAAFSALWNGDTGAHAGDDSASDMALACHLAFWTRKDLARMDRLFRQSGLYRDNKWDDRRGDSTYGGRTLEKAIGLTTEVYEPSIAVKLNGHRNGHSNGGSQVSDQKGTDEPKPTFLLTDYGNAERLIARHGQDLRYCHPWQKWLVWDGKRWCLDDTAQIERWAKETVRSIYAEAAATTDTDDREKIVKHAVRSEAKARIDAMIALAASELGVPVKPDQLDADPWLLTVENGTIDLRTKTLRKSDRRDYITKLAPVLFDPDATCPRWLAFLEQILPSASVRRFIQKAIGYTLTGQTSERAIFILHGTGANGKTTLFLVGAALLGEYARRTPTDTLLIKRDAGIPNDVARLKGARFVYASEAEEGRRLAESLIKDLTGGDSVSARFMRGEWFEFSPEFKMWLGTNHKPVIRGTDQAIWDRIRLIPFAVTIPENERIPRHILVPQLLAELPGILQWALDGCAAWQSDGLVMPDEVKEATKGYRESMDLLADFLAECCQIGPTTQVPASRIYDAYSKWCEENGEKPTSPRGFGLRLSERGFQAFRGTGGKRSWVGVGLVTHEARVTHSDADSGIAASNLSHEEITRKSITKSHLRHSNVDDNAGDFEEGVIE